MPVNQSAFSQLVIKDYTYLQKVTVGPVRDLPPTLLDVHMPLTWNTHHFLETPDQELIFEYDCNLFKRSTISNSYY